MCERHHTVWSAFPSSFLPVNCMQKAVERRSAIRLSVTPIKVIFPSKTDDKKSDAICQGVDIESAVNDNEMGPDGDVVLCRPNRKFNALPPVSLATSISMCFCNVRCFIIQKTVAESSRC